MKHGSILVLVAIFTLFVATPASAHVLGKWEAEVKTRLAVSDRADDDCDYASNVLNTDEALCDYASYPEASCWRLTKHKIRCEADVKFYIIDVDDNLYDEDYYEMTCTYRTTVKYKRATSWFPQIRITSGPKSCY